MKYLSVCSGIEAATVAWHGLGWEPVAFSEIEAFPAAVLEHHYPTVPNLGDLTKYREWPEELLVEVDLLVGGTPCQAFSVAGLRRSLDDERGNLSLTYVNLYHHINEVRRSHGRPPAIALWENVPGVLSTKDNAFGCFIGGLLGCDDAPQTESGKWHKAGFLSSETVRVGYRVLDAQYFGVAQRRRRVFLAAVPCELVERFGERACPSEILSLRESVLGNPPTRGAAWEGVARATASGLTGSGRGVERCGESRGQDYVVIWSSSDQANAERLVDQAGTLNCNMGQRGGWISGHPDHAYAISAGQQGKGGVFGSGRDSQDTFVTCFHPTQDPICSSDGSTHAIAETQYGSVCGSLTARHDSSPCADRGQNVVAFTQNTRDEVRQINGDGRIVGALSAESGMKQTNYIALKESQSGCRTGDVHATIDANKGSRRVGGVVAIQERAVCENPEAGPDGAGVRDDGVSYTLEARTVTQAVSSAMQVRRLCPSECEALQGFPIGYTDVTYRKKPACDGPRYRALGNSMAVPCMWWLGYRIQKATA